MPMPGNLRISDILGSSEKENREGTIDVFEVEHALNQPFDPTTGMRTGVRIHSPMRVTCIIDKATPALFKATATGRTFPTVILEFYRIDPGTRSEVKYYEVTMRNVSIVSAVPFVPNTLKPENEALRHMMQYSFVYEEIEWNYMPDSMVETDRWRDAEE